jgi:hypothetical protein
MAVLAEKDQIVVCVALKTSESRVRSWPFVARSSNVSDLTDYNFWVVICGIGNQFHPAVGHGTSATCTPPQEL